MRPSLGFRQCPPWMVPCTVLLGPMQLATLASAFVRATREPASHRGMHCRSLPSVAANVLRIALSRIGSTSSLQTRQIPPSAGHHGRRLSSKIPSRMSEARLARPREEIGLASVAEWPVRLAARSCARPPTLIARRPLSVATYTLDTPSDRATRQVLIHTCRRHRAARPHRAPVNVAQCMHARATHPDLGCHLATSNTA